MRDANLNKLAHSIIILSNVIEWPPGKVGAIQRFSVDKEALKQLKPKHFNHPKQS